MVEFKIMEKSSGKILDVLAIDRQEGKTYFLVWQGEYFKWLDMRKAELVENINWG